jgi:glycine dehydrogenase subunit 2
MLTNPSTLGVFERKIEQVARIVHDAGGLLYYDGANLNAILGKGTPRRHGFRRHPHEFAQDVLDAARRRRARIRRGRRRRAPAAVPADPDRRPRRRALPVARRTRSAQSIGRLSGFMGNAGVNLRAYIYMRMLGREGMTRVAQFATLNANYLLKRLINAGFDAAYPARRASHEFIITLKRQHRDYQVSAMDVAKRLLDYGFHAPTTYFPLLVPECLLIEPTETEAKEDLDRFCDAMIAILQEMTNEPEKLTSAPLTMPVRRLDDVRAAKQLDLVWKRADSA